MTYQDLEKVNSEIKTIDVKGKEYAEVPQRVQAFRKLFPQGEISTEIISLENGVVTMKATVIDDEGSVLATGYAQEKESSSFINKTSFIENCETSAVGRALGFAGIGSKTSIASAEEVRNAINNQPKDEGTKVKEALEAAKARGAATEEITYESALIMKVNEKSLKDWYKCDKDFIAQLRETGTEQIKKAIGIIDAKIAAYNKK